MSDARLIPRKSIVLFSPGSLGVSYAWDASEALF